MRKFNNIAALVKKKRLSHPQGLSQSDLSHILGYKNGQFISNVERALCNIPFKMIGKLCRVLNIDPTEIKQSMLKDHEETLEAYIKMDMVKNGEYVDPASVNVSNPATTANQFLAN